MSIDLYRQVVSAAADFEIANLLHDVTLVDDVAGSIDVDVHQLSRLLRGMAHFGLCRDHGGGRFELTDAGRCLRADHRANPDCDALRRLLTEHPTSGMLVYSLRNRKPAFERAFGLPFFEYIAGNPWAAGRFGSLMAADTESRAVAVASRYDFSSARRVVDVGGGHGALIIEILKHHPHLSGVLFDVDTVVRQAKHRIDSEGLAARCDLVAGNVFEWIPTDGDVYVYSQILHDWNDAECRSILSTCRRSVDAEDRVLLIEALMPERIERACAVVELDLMMLMLTGGRERTYREYRDLLEPGGFQLTAVFPIDETFSILEACPTP